MCARIKIKLFVFRTVISRVQLCQISKGCRVSRHPSGVKDHPMNRIRKIYRVNLRQRKPYGMLYRSRLTGYLWRDAGVSWNTTPRHFCNVFLPDGSYHPFPQSSFSPVRLQSSFARCRKQESLPWPAAPLHHLQAEDAECIFTSKMCELTNKYLEQLILSVASGELDDRGLLNWLQGHIE